MKYSKEEIKNAREALADLLPSGSTVYTVLRSVSRSGMFRRIDLYTIDDNPRMREINGGKPRMQYISGYVAVLLGLARPPMGTQGLGVKGCGMDMGFHIVDSLAGALFGYGKTENGYKCKGELRHEWI